MLRLLRIFKMVKGSQTLLVFALLSGKLLLEHSDHAWGFARYDSSLEGVLSFSARKAALCARRKRGWLQVQMHSQRRSSVEEVSVRSEGEFLRSGGAWTVSWTWRKAQAIERLPGREEGTAGGLVELSRLSGHTSTGVPSMPRALLLRIAPLTAFFLSFPSQSLW